MIQKNRLKIEIQICGEKEGMRHEVTTHQNPNTVHGVDFVYYGDQGRISH